MIKWVRNINKMRAVKDVHDVGDILDKLLLRFKDDVDKVIQEKTFAYTKDINDTKSDYLKRYLETKYNGVSDSIMDLQLKINPMQVRIEALEKDLEERRLDEEYITYKEPKE